MDLLSRPTPLVTAAVLTAAVMLLGGCDSGDEQKGDGGDTPSAGADSPSASESAGTLPRLEQVRPDEVVAGAGDGRGQTPGVVAGRSDDLVIVYGVCDRPGTELVLTVTLRQPERLAVPCDGVVSRAQVLTTPGQRFGVDVAAPDGVRWNVLVTTRSER